MYQEYYIKCKHGNPSIEMLINTDEKLFHIDYLYIIYIYKYILYTYESDIGLGFFRGYISLFTLCNIMFTVYIWSCMMTCFVWMFLINHLKSQVKYYIIKLKI